MRLFICALWSPAGKGLTSWLSFVVSAVSLSLSHWYPGSGVVLDCIDSLSLHPYLLYTEFCKIVSYFRRRPKSWPLFMFFEKNKLYNDYFPSYEYDTLQAYSYGYNRFISKGCLVW